MLAALSSETARRGLERDRTVDLATRALSSRWLADADPLLLLLHALFALTIAGKEIDAAKTYALAIDAARRRGEVFNVAALSVFRGWLRLRTGELLAAEEDLQPTGEGTDVDDPSFRLYRAVFLADVLLERGQMDDARALLAGPFTVDAPVHQSYSLYVRGRVAMALNHPQQALDTFLALGDVCTAMAIAHPSWTPWRAEAALAAHRVGRHDVACSLATDELEAARRWGAPWGLGVALRAVGLTAAGPDGLNALREAVEVLEPSPARLAYARALIDLGAALRRANQRREARELLRDGVDRAHACGAKPLAVRGNDELAATGARPRSAMITGRDALTASERRVAQLALDGLSNRDIAQSLFVTVKTVEVHLGRTYRKLDIASRRELRHELLA